MYTGHHCFTYLSIDMSSFHNYSNFIFNFFLFGLWIKTFNISCSISKKSLSQKRVTRCICTFSAVIIHKLLSYILCFSKISTKYCHVAKCRSFFFFLYSDSRLLQSIHHPQLHRKSCPVHEEGERRERSAIQCVEDPPRRGQVQLPGGCPGPARLVLDAGLCRGCYPCEWFVWQ